MRRRCPPWMSSVLYVGLATCCGCPNPPGTVPTPGSIAASFVNFESPHVSPLGLTPDGLRLLAVNTADNSLAVFDLSSGMPLEAGRIAVGLDPVSVRARSAQEAWVVNRLSDSVSVVDLDALAVVRTLRVGDEPGDVVFAAGRAFVSCLEPSRVLVYDLDNLDGAPVVLPIAAHDPRALAVSADGSRVYAAVFESGNHTTVLAPEIVDQPDSPYGGENPPGNVESGFVPSLTPGMGGPPRVSLIVQKEVSSGRWLDDNGRDWSAKVGWDVHDHDLAIIDTTSLAVRYVRGLMTANMQLAARPDGRVVVVGTEASNVIRFEPNLAGRFVRTVAAVVDPDRGDAGSARRVVDLNPHLADAYAQGLSQVPADLRSLSLADPRGIAWRSDGAIGYVSGMGSNNVIAIDASGGRLGQADVGAGPTGLVLDEARGRLYVLNRFDATISILDASDLAEVGRVAMFDPTPAEVKVGRPLLYDARRTSGLGVTACAGCHLDARMDGLAWDLGNPAGQVQPFDQQCDSLDGLRGEVHCEDFHPMKGPMVTQSLQSIIGTEPLHWRGDRASLSHFNAAFTGLLGGERELTEQELADLRAFLSTIRYPGNPNRNLDDSLKGWLGEGSPSFGEIVFTSGNHDRNVFNCNRCHAGSLGTNQSITPGSELAGASMKVPQLRGLYKKSGFRKDSFDNDSGFGFVHDGRFGTIPEFLHFEVFRFPIGEAGEQQRRDLEAFLRSFPGDVPPAVGTQVTLAASSGLAPETESLLGLMLSLADGGKVGLVVHGRVAGVPRGYAYIGSKTFQADRAGEQIDAASLRALCGPGAEQTWTVVPLGSETRIGIDHDGNGVFDGDESR